MENIVLMHGYSYSNRPGRKKEEENYKSIAIDKFFSNIFFYIVFFIYMHIRRYDNTLITMLLNYTTWIITRMNINQSI